MASRLNLQTELATLPVTKVYFQPPESMKLEYDCIVYSLMGAQIERADNITYFYERKYQLTLITRNPDSEVIDMIPQKFRKCEFIRHFKSNNLNHYIYYLYY